MNTQEPPIEDTKVSTGLVHLVQGRQQMKQAKEKIWISAQTFLLFIVHGILLFALRPFFTQVLVHNKHLV